MKKVNLPFDNAVMAKTHSQLYLMHKFWARKPANVVTEYIKYYTNPGNRSLINLTGRKVHLIHYNVRTY